MSLDYEVALTVKMVLWFSFSRNRSRSNSSGVELSQSSIRVHDAWTEVRRGVAIVGRKLETKGPWDFAQFAFCQRDNILARCKPKAEAREARGLQASSDANTWRAHEMLAVHECVVAPLPSQLVAKVPHHAQEATRLRRP